MMYDVLRTIAGVPNTPESEIILIIVSTVLSFLFIFLIIDLMRSFIKLFKVT